MAAPLLTRFLQAIRRTVRYRLLALVLFPVLVVTPVILFLTVSWSKDFAYGELFVKVNTDLSVAHDVFIRTQQDYLGRLGGLAESYRFRVSLEQGDADALLDHLQAVKDSAGFSFLHLTDPVGTVRYEASQQRVRPTPLQERARRGIPSVGIEIFSNEELERESPLLAERVRLTLIDTPRAVPTERVVEDRGMLIRLVYPVLDLNGVVVALLDGGVLLNRNFHFVDTIRDLVYGPGSLPEGSIGTVTVFLDDVRITTNVPMHPGERALGTRVSREVRDYVLGEGQKWIDRAFVVNDWYISSYEPILDVEGRRVGMLYAGFLETPFRLAWQRALALLLVLFFVVIGFSSWLAVRGARTIFRPLEAMASVVRATKAGENRRIGPIRSDDELGELAGQFDDMLDRLQEHSRRLEDAAEQLEAKVEARTAELSSRNDELERTVKLLRETRRQLVMAEKLAALGELTAGVAHEINNPTAVILGHLDLLISDLGDSAQAHRSEIDLIIEQVYRIRSIVNNLLQYARPSVYVGQLQDVDVNAVVADTLVLVDHALRKSGARVRKRLEASGTIRMNRQELQQVLVNLVVNAAHAVERGGRVEIVTEDWDGGVCIMVSDDGPGIAEEHLTRLFDPFFTTKSDGTGLGLSVTYGIVRRYGGDIAVDSVPGQGAQFRVMLRERPPEQEGSGDLHELAGAESDADLRSTSSG